METGNQNGGLYGRINQIAGNPYVQTPNQPVPPVAPTQQYQPTRQHQGVKKRGITKTVKIALIGMAIICTTALVGYGMYLNALKNIVSDSFENALNLSKEDLQAFKDLTDCEIFALTDAECKSMTERLEHMERVDRGEVKSDKEWYTELPGQELYDMLKKLNVVDMGLFREELDKQNYTTARWILEGGLSASQ